eukprot:gene10723-7131_t
MAAVGRLADAAGWVARSHRAHLHLPPTPTFVPHLATAAALRFRCGHAAKAVSTLRRAAGNDSLTAIAPHPWSLRAALASALWLSRDTRGAAAAASRALRVPPWGCDQYVVWLIA